MKEGCIGKDAVEMTVWQVELEEILLPYFATAMSSGHCRKTRCAVQTDREVATIGQSLEIASRSAAQIK
jgi:hypothetical protein